MYKLLTRGNSKLSKNVLIFDLPTKVCASECPKCYARKAEIWPNVTNKRDRSHEASLDDSFIDIINSEIKNNKNCNIVRIHSSGDFYSQEYVDKWHSIVKINSHVEFYAYTKRYDESWFEHIKTLHNFNLINSMTPLGYNYGTEEYCNKLVEEYGYTLCPCRKGVKVVCMKDCNECLTNDKVCFIQH